MASIPSPSPTLIASLYSTSTLNVLANGDPALIAERTAPLAALVQQDPDATLGEAFDAGLRVLRDSYRSEYFYKNAIVSKLVFGRHRPTTAAALLELPANGSIADVVILNGTSTAYEIKTDLDSLGRLPAQVNDYLSCFEHVNVVATESRAESILAVVPDCVGVLALKRNGALATVRSSAGGLDRLRPDRMFEMLRQAEARALLGITSNFELDVPSGRAWARLKEKFLELRIEVQHQELVRQLKTRALPAAGLTTQAGFPASLRALAYTAKLPHGRLSAAVSRLSGPAVS